MKRYLLGRILWGLPVLWGVLSVTFFLLHLVPGDPVSLLLGEGAEESDRLALRQTLGLERPLVDQYFTYVLQLAKGNWGESISHRLPVLDLILERFPSTLLLTLTSLTFATLVSVPIGLGTAAYRGRWPDRLGMFLALMGHSVPLFVIAPLVVLAFAIDLPLLPVSGSGTWAHLVLPTFCLGFGLCGLLSRMLRSSAVDVVGSMHVRAARSRGIGPWRLYSRYILKVSVLPVLSVWGGLLGGLLGGAVVTETLFDWPGLGRLFYTAFQARDYPLIQGIVLWISVVYVGIQVLLDFAYAGLDPRIRLGAEEGA